jgi:SAM-dependent methyltransferase
MNCLWDERFHLFRRSTISEFVYSDGAEGEARLLGVVSQAKDRGTFSPELAGAISDWPSEYHLSRARHCVVRPPGIRVGDKVLELGCGCGAVTRYLGEIGANVVAVEGSLAGDRVAAERSRDLANVRVFVDDLLCFDTQEAFDWVFLIGVLEYAAVFSASENPFEHYLRSVSRFRAALPRPLPMHFRATSWTVFLSICLSLARNSPRSTSVVTHFRHALRRPLAVHLRGD